MMGCVFFDEYLGNGCLLVYYCSELIFDKRVSLRSYGVCDVVGC